jgi:hypothetical protein
VLGGIERVDQVSEDNQRGGGVEESVVPGFFGDEGADLRCEGELVANIAERVVAQIGPSGPSKQKGVDPRAESMTRKSPQKALFRAFAVSDDDRASEAFF